MHIPTANHITVLENETMVNKAVSVVQEIVEDISSPSVGFMFTVPIAKVYPMKKD